MEEQEIQVVQEQFRQKAQQLAMAAQIVKVATAVLGLRFVLLLALLLDAGMFSWAMLAGSWERITAAVLFSIASWFLIKVEPRPPSGASHGT